MKVLRPLFLMMALMVLVSATDAVLPDFLTAATPAAQAPKVDPRAQEARTHFKNAAQLQKNGKLKAAVVEYRAVTKLVPTFVAPFFNLGVIYAALNQTANAEAAFRRVIALEPKNEMAMEQLVRVLIMRGKGGEALNMARKLLGQKPKDPRVRFLFGAVNLQLKKYDAAEDAFKSVIHADPKNEIAYVNLAMCYAGAKKYGDLLEISELMIKRNSEDAQARMFAAFAAVQIGDKEQSIMHYEAAARMSSSAIPALIKLAWLYRDTEKLEKSADAMMRVIKLDKNNFDANFNLGAYEYSRGKYKEAEAYWTVANRTRPKIAMVLTNLAMAQARQQKFKEALPNASAAFRIEPKNKMIMEAYGYLLECNQKLPEALQVYSKWKQYYPNDAVPYRRSAGVYLFQNNRDKGWVEYDAALKRAPKDVELVNSYAEALRSVGQFDKAFGMYEKALKLKPNDANLMINTGLCLQSMNRMDDAITWLKKAIDADPKSNTARSAIARVYEGQKNYDLAIEEYKKILESDSKSIPTLLSLAKLYDDAKDYDSEVATYKKLRDLEPKNDRYAMMIPNIYDRAGKLDMAIDEAKSLVAAAPENAQYRFSLGSLLVKKPDYQGALDQYTEVTKSEDAAAKSYAYQMCGTVYEKQDKSDEAIAAYKNSVDAQVDSMKLLALGKVYEGQKRSEEYHAYLKSLFESDKPDLPYRYFYDTFKAAGKGDEAIKSLEMVAAKKSDNDNAASALGAAYADSGQKDKAIEQFNKINVKKPGDVLANYELGKLYKSMERYQEAADHYAVAAKKLTMDRGLLMTLGEIYEKLGKKPNALKTYRDYLKFDPANDVIKQKVRDLETVKAPEPTISAPATPAVVEGEKK